MFPAPKPHIIFEKSITNNTLESVKTLKINTSRTLFKNMQSR